MTQIAARIVELQNAIVAGQGDLHSLQAEQRRLWDEHFSGRSFESIVADTWLTKRPEYARRTPRPLA